MTDDNRYKPTPHPEAQTRLGGRVSSIERTAAGADVGADADAASELNPAAHVAATHAPPSSRLLWPATALQRTRDRGRMLFDVAYDVADRLTARAEVHWEVIKVRVMPEAWLAKGMQPDIDDEDDWRFLRRPALLGFLALISVAWGGSLVSSPFKYPQAGTWFFGMNAHGAAYGQSYLLFGLVAVFGGLVLLMRVWLGLARALERRPGVPIKYLGWMFTLWILPMLVVPPLFSRDVYSYAAQGEMMSHHLNVYALGPAQSGSTAYTAGVDRLWANTPAPYGPLFLMIDGFLASASFHHAIYTVVLLRLLALAGVALAAWCMPKLARAYGRDPGPVFVLAILNPLVILMLVAGAHNDAIMVGLLVAGITAAKYKHPVWGVVLCTLAAAIKVPAALGIIYVAWDWLGVGVPWRQRVRPLITAWLVAGMVMVALSMVSGLGFGWIANLGTPGTVRSWLAPATGIGMGLTGVAHLVGLGIPQSSVLTVTRLLGLGAAAAAAVYLLKVSDRIGSLKAFGLSLLLFVVLGPVVQPWYLTWGLILLAPVAKGRLRNVVIVFAVVSPFLQLPGGHRLLSELLAYNLLSSAVALIALLAALVVPLGRWATAWRDPDDAAVDSGAPVAVDAAGAGS